MAGETSIGSIVGFLRLDADQFHRELVQAISEVEALDGKRAHVKIDVDSSNVDASMDRTGAAAERTERSLAKVDRQSRQSQRGIGALATAIIALGPALVPIAAGATGLAAAFGGMGIAGVAAVFGIRDEMERGTSIGLAYRGSVDDARDSMLRLARTSAANVLGSFQTVVRQLVDSTPRLTRQVGELSTMTGKAGASLAGGLLSAFMALEPLMRDAAVYVVNLTARFQGAMSGGGIKAFGDYIRSVFPQVVADLESVVTAASHLIQALAPLGLGTLSMLGMLSDLISALPVDVLERIAPLATGVYLGFQAWQGLSGIVTSFGTALQHLGATAAQAATAMRVLNIATGIIGAALGVLTVIFSNNAEANRQAEQAANDYADALRRSNGVVDESIRQMTAKKLADEGVLDAGRKLGVNLSDITDAALGNADAQARVNAVLDAQKDKLKTTVGGAKSGVRANTELGDSAEKVTGAIDGTNAALTAGIQKNKDIAAASAQTHTALSNEAVVVSTLAARYGMSVATYQAVKGATEKQAQAHAQATAKMQLENDAAGLLKQSLDALAGKSLSTAQAQNGFDRAIVGLTQSTRNAKGAIDKTKTSLSGMGEAAVTNRGNLLNLATQANGVATAVANQTGSTEKGRQKLIAMRDQIIKTATAQGMNRDEVQKFIDTVLKVPTKVPPTKADADTKAAKTKMADLKAEIIDTMRDRQANMFISVTSNVQSAVATVQSAISAIGASVRRRDGGPIPGYAGGGKLRGPGTGTSDSIMAVVRETGRPVMVSTGEYVSTAASTARNERALEAGNRGATLGVVGDGGLSGPLQITGTLSSPWGPVQVEGQIERALSTAAREVSRGVR